MQGRGYAQTARRIGLAGVRTRLSRRERWVTVGAIVGLQFFTIVMQGDTSGRDGSVLSPLMGFVATAVLLWHRSHLPAVVWAVGLLSLGALAFCPQTVLAVNATALIAVNLVSARATRRVSGVTAAAFAILLAATAYRWVLSEGRGSTPGVGLAALAATLVLGSWAVGQVWHARAQELESIRERMRQAEVGRVQAEQIAVLTERARIAREMHDIIAHSVSGMVALADGGRYAGAQDPRAAERALEEIAQGGRQTLGELRGVISTLRGPSGEPGGTHCGISEVADLVASTVSRGFQVELRTEGRPRPVPSSTGFATYRLVQEGLTNVVKHVGVTAQVNVTLTWWDDLTVEIRDDGGGSARLGLSLGEGRSSGSGGSGLIGMRERTEALFGTLETGPQRGGGFIVRARIPLPEESA